MVPVVGPFLFIGIVAWVAAIVLGVGSWFGLTDWRQRWAIVGALAGLGTFQLYLAQVGYLPVLVFDPRFVFPATAALFVGAGVATAFGTLFVPGGRGRPKLEAGSPEEMLWLHDTIDRLRPRRLDWLMTGALLLPGAGLVQLGLTLSSGLHFIIAGVVSLAGPLFAALGLTLRGRRAREYAAELEAREGAALGAG